MKFFKMLIKPALQNQITKDINVLELNVLLISSKAPNLHSVIYSEMNTASITSKGVVVSSCFL